MILLTEGPDIPTAATKAMETGGVAATILLVVTGCILALLWGIARFWKSALRPFFESLTNVMEAHRDTVREANELAKEVRFIHEKHRHLLTQSPSPFTSRGSNG